MTDAERIRAALDGMDNLINGDYSWAFAVDYMRREKGFDLIIETRALLGALEATEAALARQKVAFRAEITHGEAAEARVARLEAALREIASDGCMIVQCKDGPVIDTSRPQKIAREALGSGREGTNQ